LALTAAISDSGLGLQPVAEKRKRVAAKIISDLHLITEFLSFQAFAVLSREYLFLEDNAME